MILPITINQLVTEISVSPTTADLLIGETKELAVTVVPSNISNQLLSWSSSDTSVATVDENGIVTGIDSGTAIITVSAKDGSNKTASCTVSVKQKAILTNLVTNGSFENGLTGWSIVSPESSNTWEIATIPMYGNSCAYRVPSTAFYNYLSQSVDLVEGHVYYYFMYGMSETEQSLVCDVFLMGGNIKVTTGSSTYTKGSAMLTSTATGTNSLSVNYEYSTDNIYIDGVGLVDLTEAFGAGREPDSSWCDENIDYFEGSTIVYK